MAVDRTVFDAMLKEDYGPPIRDQINRATASLDILKPKSVPVIGRNFIVPLISAQHKGISSRSGATKTATKLPAASNQGYKVATYNVKYHYGRIEVDGPSMRSSETSRGAFEQSLDAEIQGITVAMAQDMNRQIHGDGVNRLADITTAGNNTVNVDVASSRFLHPGMISSILTESDGTVVVTSATISSITSETRVVLSAAATFTTTDGLFSAADGSYSTGVGTPYRNAITGFKALFATTNVTNMGTDYIGDISRAAAGNDFWRAQVLANSGTKRPLSVGLMQQAISLPQSSRYGGKRPNYGMCDYDMFNTYGNAMVGDKRFRGEALRLDGGWDALDIGGIMLVAEKDCEPNRFYFWHSDHIFFLTQTDTEWMDEDGSILFRVADYDSYEASLVCDKELATDKPANLSLLDDISVNIS